MPRTERSQFPVLFSPPSLSHFTLTMDPKQQVYSPHMYEYFRPPRSPIDTTFYVVRALTEIIPPPTSWHEDRIRPMIQTLITLALRMTCSVRVSSPQAFGDDVRANIVEKGRELLDTVVTPVLPLAPDPQKWEGGWWPSHPLVRENEFYEGDCFIELHGAQPLGPPTAVRDLPFWHNRDAIYDLVASVPEMYFILDPKYQTRRLRLHAVRHNPRAIVMFTQTPELVKAALTTIDNTIYGVYYSTAHFIRDMTPELATLAVKFNPFALHDLPRALITPELCDMATQAAPITIQSVPDEYRTEAMCQRLLEDFDTQSELFKYIPERFHDRVFTEENLLRAINKNAWVPSNVPAKYLTVNIYQLACRRGYDLCDVPDHLRPAVAAALDRQCMDEDA